MAARTLALLLTGFALSSVAAPLEPADRFYLAIRNNDMAALRTLIKSAGVETREKRGATPLMLASAYGSLDAMKLLIAAGDRRRVSANLFEQPLLLGFKRLLGCL